MEASIMNCKQQK